MGHTGKPCKARTSITCVPAVIGIVLLSVAAVHAQRTDQKGEGIGGFRELRWGTSVEEATGIYRDLSFERYVISNDREEPRKVYVRKAERGEIENVTFDSIEYWFKGDRFYQIRAVLQSRIGPRTLVTQAETDFEKIRQRMQNRYGNPSHHKIDYVTEFIVVVKESTWIVDQTVITVKYEGVGGTNEDLLTFTMKEKRSR